MKLSNIRLAAVMLVLAVSSAARADEAMTKKVRAILDTHCHRCHGQDGAVEGGMNYILDLDKLVQRKKVVPGQPDKSPLYKKIVNNLMPPPDEKPRPSDAEREVLRQWIAAGAPRPASSTAQRAPIRDSDITNHILADLDKIEPRSRRFARYFSLAHLYNAGLGEDELQTYRNALAKLINSLSWHPRVTVPRAIDIPPLPPLEKGGPGGIILAIDLRHYMWDHNLWNRVLVEYPYGVFQDTAADRIVAVSAATRMPCLRADWFIATASRAPLYYDLLQTPNQIAELERQVRVDLLVNIQQERVARAGFNGSGVSRNNRILERHDSVHGAYWRTYDFDSIPQNLVERQNLLPDRRNIFAYPLGPGNLENHFQHAGGEVIYNLPNGLHAYVLINAIGVRVDKAPTPIVSDPRRPDRAVEAGLSCMACHVRGINLKDDQVREYVEKNPKAFGRAEADLIKALYAPRARMKTLMDRDAEQFRQAVEKTGAKVSTTETIMSMVLRYEADLDLPTAAAELGLTPEELLKKLGESQLLARNFGSLQVEGGTVARQVLIQAFGDMVKELRLGILFQSTQTGQTLPDNTGEVDPLEGRSSQANSLVFTADGRYALLASADKTVRLWDIDGNRELRRFVGHRASVWSVAVSADGKQALSGSADQTVRLWDVGTGRESKRLDGHLGVVTCLAISADSTRALSGSYDRSVILWDLQAGKEIRRFDNPGYVNAVAFYPGGRHALVAVGKTIRMLDLDSGKETTAFAGHTDAVVCLALSADGKRLLTGGDDRTLRLWDLEWKKLLHTFNGHAGPVKGSAFSPDGKRLASASVDGTVRVWDADGGTLLGTFARHKDAVLAVIFTADGRFTLSGSADSVILDWSLEKALKAAGR